MVWCEYLFVNNVEIHKLKRRDSEINAAPICLGNVLKDFSVDNMIICGLCGYVYHFSVDYHSVDVDGILDAHKHLMRNHDIKQCLD